MKTKDSISVERESETMDIHLQLPLDSVYGHDLVFQKSMEVFPLFSVGVGLDFNALMLQ